MTNAEDHPTFFRARLPLALLLALGVLILLLAQGSQLLNDPDTQWHVATGRWIWAHKALPTTDVFSHTFAGAPWIAKEWISQLILFAAHELAGWRGVVVVAAVAIAATYAILFDWLLQRVRLSVALAATLVAVTLAAPHFLARPHALVFPIIAVWITQLVTALERRTAPPLAVALLMVLWTNMHGSFPLGLVLAGMLAGEAVLGGRGAERVAALRGWGLFLVAAGAAALVSPYGWDAVLVPLHLGHNEALPFLSEWQPLALDATGLLALGLLAATLLVLAKDARTNIFRIALVLLLAGMMIRHSRFIDLFALVAPVLMARSLATRWGLAPDPEDKGGKGSLWAAGAAMLAVVATAGLVAPRLSPKMTPDAAFRTAMARGVSGAVYNDYDFGGFLIAQDVKTFVDGRTDQLFLGDFLPGVQRALDAKDARAFSALLARHGVGWALVRPRSKEAAHLAAMPGWRKLYEDGVAAVFAAAPAAKAARVSAAR